MENHYKMWRFDALADKIPQNFPVHFIGAARDCIVPPSAHILPLYRLLQQRNMDVSYQELATGHIFAQ
jgi:predicted esterase